MKYLTKLYSTCHSSTCWSVASFVALSGTESIDICSVMTGTIYLLKKSTAIMEVRAKFPREVSNGHEIFQIQNHSTFSSTSSGFALWTEHAVDNKLNSNNSIRGWLQADSRTGSFYFDQTEVSQSALILRIQCVNEIADGTRKHRLLLPDFVLQFRGHFVHFPVEIERQGDTRVYNFPSEGQVPEN